MKNKKKIADIEFMSFIVMSAYDDINVQVLWTPL